MEEKKERGRPKKNGNNKLFQTTIRFYFDDVEEYKKIVRLQQVFNEKTINKTILKIIKEFIIN